MDGIRNYKTVGSTVYHFDTLSGKVMHQTGDDRELLFIYDENGQPYILISKEGSDVQVYWYLLNAVGDVIGLLNSTQQIVTTYRYDPYGRIIDEWISSTDDIGIINPLRYRGYYFDSETGFYYLQSRYYDPEIGRFISADTFATTSSTDFLSCNMFAYNLNDPVNRIDDGGNYSFAAASFIVGFIVGGASQILTNAACGKDVSEWGEGFLGAAVGGGLGGLMAVKGGMCAIISGYASAFAEACANELVVYDQGIKQINTEDILSSIGAIALGTVANGTVYTVTGTIASQVIPTSLGFRDTVELLTQSAEMGSEWATTAFQSTMVMIGNIGNTISNNYLTSAKVQSSSTNKSKPSWRRPSRPAFMIA